jgi:hypothetical protein
MDEFFQQIIPLSRECYNIRNVPSVPSEKSGEQKEGGQTKTSLAQDKPVLPGETRGVMVLRDALRGIALLAIGIIACFAFVFSFRAYRISQACYQMITRLQAGRKNLKDKEEER